MLTSEIITDGQRFFDLKSDWQALLYKSDASIFQSWPWCWHWWSLNKTGKRLAIITVKEKNQLVGLLPLFISKSYIGLPFKVAALLGTGTFDYGGILIDSTSDRRLVLNRIIECLAGQKWDAVDLHQLPARNPIIRSGENLFTNMEKVFLIEQEATWLAALPSDIQLFRADFSKKFRTNLDYNWRRLERDHLVTIKVSRTDEVPSDIDSFFMLHQKRWRKKRLPGAFFSGKNRDFHRLVAADLSESENLKLSFLLVDGETVASVYGFQLRDVFFYYLGGFDPEWGSRSVSSLLLDKLTAQAINDGCRVFDFLRGEESYKSRWLAKPETNYRFLAVRSTFKSEIIKKMLTKENELVIKAKARLHD